MKDEMNDELPEHLKNVSRNNVFSTPEHYFEKLPSAISDRIHATGSIHTTTTWNPLRIFSMAGFTVAIVIIAWMYFSKAVVEQTPTPELTYDDIVNSGMVAEIDESLIQELYTTTTDSLISTEPVVNDDEHLKEYLIENNIDISFIINEL